MKNSKIWLLIILTFFISNSIFAQTTGKIAGTITDAKTGDKIPGANIWLEGSTIGTASDENGNYYLINVPPGEYTLVVQVIGYKTEKITGVKVSVNRTTYIDVDLDQTSIEGETVVVEADRIAIKKDQTSTIKNVSQDQIEKMPVENVATIVNMQAGVVAGHFRGGRSYEVSYMIDGLRVDELFTGNYSAVMLEPEAVQDLEVITGTFNAEYGQAMSGVVNMVTREGGNDFHGFISGSFSNYFTTHDEIFIGIDEAEIDRNKDYKFQLSGPIIKDFLTFFINYRKQDNKGHLNGIRRFRITDYSDFSSMDSTEWYSENTGDNKFVPMNWNKNQSLMTKFTFKPFSKFKLSLLYNTSLSSWKSYNHTFKYNPDGQLKSYGKDNLLSIQINHMISTNLFYELKMAKIYDYYGNYHYENPYDSRYINDRFLNNNGCYFYTGGQEGAGNRFGEYLGKPHTKRYQTDYKTKFDLTWQANTNHSFKTGFEYAQHILDNQYHVIRNKYAGTDSANLVYQPVIYPDSTRWSDVYVVKPYEYSLYIQDKMEFNEMVINIGLRYDYFDPNTTYPTDLRNPANQLSLPDSMMSKYVKADPKVQISPRFGLAYQLGSTAILHFSYGHFFQTPPLYAFYQNHSHLVGPRDFEATMGNPQLKAQKTVTYEVGLWQELIRDLGLEVTLFYRDIYNLLSTKVMTTYNQIRYGIYTNKDYGNARGLEVKLDFVRGPISLFLNYTLQYTRGNADTPEQNFNREGNNMDPIIRYIPMSWDQRHTFNLTVGYNTDRWGITFTGYYNSGTPYTWSPIPENRISRLNLYPNNDYISQSYSVDATGYYDIISIKRFELRMEWSIYNLFDRLNEVWVNGQTGRAYTAIVRPSDLESYRSNFSTYDETYKNPSAYSVPRTIKIGLVLSF
ncbi:MAG: TonB-dependent receptor [Candidatus Marinimicrobia bacterium]|nr:TonB-dependent receptor [Candidatus Neomarinimicrobiota bacterium]